MPQIKFVDEVADVVHEDIMGKWEVVHKNSSVVALFGRQSYEIKDDHGRLLLVQWMSEGVLKREQQKIDTCNRAHLY